MCPLLLERSRNQSVLAWGNNVSACYWVGGLTGLQQKNLKSFYMARKRDYLRR